MSRETLCKDELHVSNSGRRIVERAEGELHKSTNGQDYGAKPDSYEKNWCSEFVSWCYRQEGYFDEIMEGTGAIKRWFLENATYVDREDSDWWKFTPTPGDWVYFLYPDDKKHSGIVECVKDGTLYTIEGSGLHRDEYPNYKTNVCQSKLRYVRGIGLRCGKRIRIENGTPNASSSGDDREPYRAFDQDGSTFWRNRTNRGNNQWLEMSWDEPQRVTKISLTFGSHYPAEYKFKFKYRFNIGWTSFYYWKSTGKRVNDRRKRSHVWFTPRKNVYGVRIQCTKYSADDYFSIYEMNIQR